MSRSPLALLFAVPVLLAASAKNEDSKPPVDFAREVRPILSDKCFACHGPDEQSREGGLRLDLKEEAFADLGGYAAIVPNDVEGSELIHRVTADFDGDLMPPPDSGLSLSPEEIDIIFLRRWIEEGAGWQQHWSFVAPTAPDASAVGLEDWPRSELDRFVLHRIETAGFTPSPEADRATLLRRATLDLTGVPPTLEELDAFLTDQASDGYERVVDRLLSSPRYGERMALPWLDAARYADTNGYHRDASRTMWLWRDWLIEALNENKPYDEFVIEQLAGDLLPNPTQDQLVATGFNRNHMLNDEGGAIPDEYQVEYVVDRVRTTSTVFLGLTMACGQCHDHKYDPVSQEDYYRFYAFFNKLAEKGLDGSNGPAEPALVVPREEDLARIAEVNGERAELRQRMDAPLPEADAAQAEWEATAAARLAQRWTPVTPTFLGADEEGVVLTAQADGSILVTGQNPQSADYELRADTDAIGITGLMLEVLSEESTPTGGTGRTSHGNWVISEFEVEAISKVDPTVREKLRFEAVAADYSQLKYNIASAVDGDLKTGWAVDGHVKFDDRNAVLALKHPVGFIGGTELVVHMRQRFGGQHTVARFRLSLASDPEVAAGHEALSLGDWHLLGPLGGSPDDLFVRDQGPERGIDLAGEQNGLRWETRPDFVDGNSHALSGENSAFYLHRTVIATAPQTLSLSLGSDDSIVAWVNGRRVLKNNAQRGVAADQERVDVPLRAGDNEILLKVVNYGGPAGFYFRVVSVGPAVLPGDVVSALRLTAAGRSADHVAALRDHFRRNQLDEWSEWQARLDELDLQVKDLESASPALMVMRDDPSVRMTTILVRGQYDQKGRQVTAGVPAFLPPIEARNGGEPDRLDLARWMVAPDHPLTARVQVNRIWQALFGTGLVETPENFGAQGEFPSNPELLDHLARRFIEQGWDVKGLVRSILLSATYRQTSQVATALYEADPRNRLHARAPSFRLQAEFVRDTALFAAGLLTEERGGPSVRPYQPDGLWKEVSFNNAGSDRKDSDFYTPDSGADLYRRGMYTFWKRSLPPPSLQTFDAPTREVCSVRRGRTNTPLQALVLLNDPTYVEAARVLAERSLLEEGFDEGERIARAFRRTTSRQPTAVEVEVLRAYLTGERRAFAEDPSRIELLLDVGESMPSTELDRTELAAWTVLGSLLLNLDETITRR